MCGACYVDVGERGGGGWEDVNAVPLSGYILVESVLSHGHEGGAVVGVGGYDERAVDLECGVVLEEDGYGGSYGEVGVDGEGVGDEVGDGVGEPLSVGGECAGLSGYVENHGVQGCGPCVGTGLRYDVVGEGGEGVAVGGVGVVDVGEEE